MSTEVDNITAARDLWRQNPGITASQVRDALGLASARIATEILKSAIEKEQQLKAKLAAEDAAGDEHKEKIENPPVAVAEPAPDPVFYLQDKETGLSHKLEIVRETKRNVVFALVGDKMKLEIA